MLAAFAVLFTATALFAVVKMPLIHRAAEATRAIGTA